MDPDRRGGAEIEKGCGEVGMKDIAQASGAPIGSLYHHFRGGKVQIAREALINAGAAYGVLIPSIVEGYTDLGEAVEGVFAQAAQDMAATGRERVPGGECRRGGRRHGRGTTPDLSFVFQGWVEGGTAFFASGDSTRARARGDARSDRRAGGCFRSGRPAQHRAVAPGGPGAGAAVSAGSR